MPRLRRENIGNYACSTFQNMLSEVLWEGSRSLASRLFDEDNPLRIVALLIKDNKESLIEEVK